LGRPIRKIAQHTCRDNSRRKRCQIGITRKDARNEKEKLAHFMHGLKMGPLGRILASCVRRRVEDRETAAWAWSALRLQLQTLPDRALSSLLAEGNLDAGLVDMPTRWKLLEKDINYACKKCMQVCACYVESKYFSLCSIKLVDIDVYLVIKIRLYTSILATSFMKRRVYVIYVKKVSKNSTTTQIFIVQSVWSSIFSSIKIGVLFS
jgi:hypothetical protein